jgi:hypothetical protein
VDLHGHAVLKAHPRHFRQHLGAEQFGLGGIGLATDHLGKQCLASARERLAVCGVRKPWSVAVAPIARKSARRRRWAARYPLQVVTSSPLSSAKRAMSRAKDRVRDRSPNRTIGRHVALPARGADRLVVGKIVGRAFGGGEQFDVEPLEQRAGRNAGLASAAPIAS